MAFLHYGLLSKKTGWTGYPIDYCNYLGKGAKNQNGNLRWHLPLGVRPPPPHSFSFAIESYIYETDFTIKESFECLFWVLNREQPRTYRRDQNYNLNKLSENYHLNEFVARSRHFQRNLDFNPMILGHGQQSLIAEKGNILSPFPLHFLIAHLSRPWSNGWVALSFVFATPVTPVTPITPVTPKVFNQKKFSPQKFSTKKFSPKSFLI